MRLTVRHSTLYHFDMPMRFVTQSHRLTPAIQRRPDGARLVGRGRGRGLRRELHRRGRRRGHDDDGAGAGRADRDRGRGHGRDQRHRGRAARPPRDRSGRRSTAGDHGDARRTGRSSSCATRRSTGPATPARSTGRTGCRRRSPTPSPTSRARPAPQTTAAEALKLGRGVCQDHAHVLIALAHAAGLPARYVTGYLLTGDGDGGRRGGARLGRDPRRGPRLGRLRPGQPLLPGRALHPPRLRPRRPRGGADPRRVARRRRRGDGRDRRRRRAAVAVSPGPVRRTDARPFPDSGAVVAARLASECAGFRRRRSADRCCGGWTARAWRPE